MHNGALLNLFLGTMASLIPLYRHVSLADVDRTSKELALTVVIIFSVVCLMPFKRRSAPYLLTYAFIGVCITALFNHWLPMGMSTASQSILAVAGAGLVFRWYQTIDHDSLSYFMDALAVGVLVQCLFGILEYFGVPNYAAALEWWASLDRSWMLDFSKIAGLDWTQDKIDKFNFFVEWRPIEQFGAHGSLQNSNFYGAFIALSSFVFLRRKWWMCLPIVAAGLILSKSLTAGATFAAIGCTYLAVKSGMKEKYVFTAMAGVVILGLVVLSLSDSGHDSGRLSLWAQSIDAIDFKSFKGIKNLLLGHGYGWHTDQAFEVVGQWGRHEHNNYLTVFNTFGLIGVAIMIGIIAMGIGYHTSAMIPAAFAGLLVNSVSHMGLYQASIAIPMAFILIMAISTNEAMNGDLDR